MDLDTEFLGFQNGNVLSAGNIRFSADEFRFDTEEEMDHGRIGGHHHRGDIFRGDPLLFINFIEKIIDRFDHYFLNFSKTVFFFFRVDDTGNNVIPHTGLTVEGTGLM